MLQPFPAVPPPEPENMCLGCLFMKLEGIPVDPKKQHSFTLKPKSAVTEEIDLYLTLQFNEQRDMLPGGRVKFGLRGGQLRLKLENGEIPWVSSEITGSVELSALNTTLQQPSRYRQSGVEVTLPESQAEVKENLSISTKETLGRIDQVQTLVCQVSTKGSQENPAWVFEAGTGEPVLKGLLKNAKLGTLNVTGKPCRVEAIFEVSPSDVYMTKAEGLWPTNISKKRSAVIERAIARRFLERRLKPYLSRQELRYD